MFLMATVWTQARGKGGTPTIRELNGEPQREVSGNLRAERINKWGPESEVGHVKVCERQ